ncbi:hypothetical protein RIF29_22428 [Crotalaria pallida]|uniref:Ferredoxin n=1 Tax=Crotalaria pallida TaxID=3830 RepID=A0AAN9I9C8_CROPI
MSAANMTMKLPTPCLSGTVLSRTSCALIKSPSSSLSLSLFSMKKNITKVCGLKSSSFRVCAMAVYNVKLIGPDGTENEFEAPDDTCILDAAENAGVEMPNLCRSGACSCCVGQLASGSVDQSNQSLLDEQQIGMGYVLPCVSYPKSDCVIYTHKEIGLHNAQISFSSSSHTVSSSHTNLSSSSEIATPQRLMNAFSSSSSPIQPRHRRNHHRHIQRR